MKIYGHQRGSIQNLLERGRNINVGIRWGGAQVAGAINGEVHLLNGLQQLQALKAAGVPCPVFTTDVRVARQWCSEGAIVFGRNTNHTQGKDIVLPGDRRWAEKDFWVKYQSSTQEWRFHILNGACIARGCKEFVPDAKHTVPQKKVIIRSRRLGWRLNHAIEPPEGLRTIAKQAVKAVKYDLGAVDMLYNSNTGVATVLEVNSRPAIRDDYTIGQYCKYFQKLQA